MIGIWASLGLNFAICSTFYPILGLFHGQILPFCYIGPSKSGVDEMIQYAPDWFLKKIVALVAPHLANTFYWLNLLADSARLMKNVSQDSLPINHGIYLFLQHLFFSSLSEFSHLVKITLSWWPRYLGLRLQTHLQLEKQLVITYIFYVSDASDWLPYSFWSVLRGKFPGVGPHHEHSIFHT